ncbi:unnamed protein product [Rotaria sordida]|uniref:Uncharacterized protein n=1 Tax=Rotaria sordida TaxID=392033 RepID=A0A815RL72_9BILA|nr:unnamed protein product [Rotaria sordida]CAF1647325.1 unnamed protein product [Rotaria sordida]
MSLLLFTTLITNNEERYDQCPSYMKLDNETKSCFNCAELTFGDISLIIKPISSCRLKVLEAIRSLGEHICMNFILHHQNPQQLTDNLRSAIGLRDDQFLPMEQNIEENALRNEFPRL